MHIIFIGNFIKNFNLPLFFGAIQALGVSLFSIVFALLFETITIANILNESVSIIYAGVLSGGIAFTLQIYAQKNISPAAPAAIVFSLEGVFATISAWIILNQILGLDNIYWMYFNISLEFYFLKFYQFMILKLKIYNIK